MKSTLLLFSLLSLIGLIGCSDNKLEGEFHTSENRQAQIGNSDQTLHLQDGDLISVEVETKGRVFNSKLIVKTPTSNLKIPVPKTAYSAKQSFYLSAFQSGLNVSVKGYPVSQFIREWDEKGTHSCDAGGDCGSMHYMYDGKGQISGMYWVSATCWGHEDVIWHRQLYHDTYKVEFGDEGYFESHPKPRQEEQVKEILSKCI